jgi:hypothetical protein
MLNKGLIEQNQNMFYVCGKSFMKGCEVMPIIKLLIFWERNHGTLWTVNRLKKTLLVLIGKPSKTIAVHKDGRLKGPFSRLSTAHAQGGQARKRCLRFLKLHGILQAKVDQKAYVSE